MMAEHRSSLTAVLAVLAAGAAGTAFAEGAVPGVEGAAKPRGHKKAPRPRPRPRRPPARPPSPAVTRAVIDREIRRIAPFLRVGKSDYSNTTNIANRAALADQAAAADQATAATTAGKATSAGSAPLASVSYQTKTVSVPTASGTLVSATASCPADQKVVGGGASLSDSPNVYVNDQAPSEQSGWNAHAYTRGTASAKSSMTVTAICVPIGP